MLYRERLAPRCGRADHGGDGGACPPTPRAGVHIGPLRPWRRAFEPEHRAVHAPFLERVRPGIPAQGRLVLDGLHAGGAGGRRVRTEAGQYRRACGRSVRRGDARHHACLARLPEPAGHPPRRTESKVTANPFVMVCRDCVISRTSSLERQPCGSRPCCSIPLDVVPLRVRWPGRTSFWRTRSRRGWR